MYFKLTTLKISLIAFLFSFNLSAQSLVLSSAAGTEAQTICEGTTLTTIEYTIGNGATGASITSGALPTGVTATFAAGVFTISGIPTGIAAAYNYTVATTGGVNSAASLSGTITIFPFVIPTFNAIPDLCYGNTAPTFQYQSLEGIQGVWAPQFVPQVGTNTYTFTPSIGQCGTTCTMTITVNPSTNFSPIASTSTTGCVGSTIQLSDVTAGGIWSTLTPAIAAVDNNGVVTCISPGTTIISYGPMTGCGTPATISITVNPVPIPRTVTSPVSYCQGTAAVTLSATASSNAIINWYQFPVGGVPLTVTPIQSTAIPLMNTYYASETDVSSGCESERVPVVIMINAIPTISFTGSTAVCEGDEAMIAATSTTSNCTFYWVGPYATFGSTASIIITNVGINATGDYIFTVTDPNGCLTNDTVHLTVNTPITPTFTYPDTICQSTSFMLPTSVDAPTISGTFEPSLLSGQLGTTVFTFTPTAGQCATPTTLSVTVLSCTGLTANVTPTTVSANGICDGTAAVNITSGLAPYHYSFSNGTTQSAATGLCEGLQTVTVSDANGDTLSLNFLIPAPANTTSTNTYLDSTIFDTLYNVAVTNCIIDYFQVDSAVITNYTVLPNDTVNVTWTVYSGGVGTSLNETYVLNAGSGVYVIALEVYCPQKSFGHFLVAYDQLYYNAADAGLAEISNDDLLVIAPNPFQTSVKLELRQEHDGEIMVRDITGNLVYTCSFSGKSIHLNLDQLASGNYIVEMITKDASIIKHIIKQ